MAEKKLIGVVVSPSNPYDRAVIDGVAQFSLERGQWAFPTVCGVPYLRPELVANWRGHGLIGQFDAATISACRARGIPCVMINTSRERQPVPSVIIDHKAVGRMAAEHLLSLGLRHFAVIAPRTSEHLFGRIDGFQRRMRIDGFIAQRVSMGVHLVKGEPTHLDVSDLRKHLGGLSGPTGIFTLHDYTARVVVETCLEMGLRVPDDVAVIGEGNWKYDCIMVRPTLTSIDIGAERIGYRAAELLNSLMAGRAWPRRPLLVPPKCVVARQTTDVLAIDDVEVREAVRFIRSHESEPIQVSDVLREVPICRRSLETRFRKSVGRSVHEEIRRSRIAWACRMLIETDMPVVRIARSGAYGGQDRFYVAFKREMKMTPLEYRRTHAGSAAES